MEYLSAFAESVEKSPFPQVGPYEQVTTKKSRAGFSLDWRGRKEIISNYKVLTVAIPSRLILPSNITLVEQGIKCSPFGVSISIW